MEKQEKCVDVKEDNLNMWMRIKEKVWGMTKNRNVANSMGLTKMKKQQYS